MYFLAQIESKLVVALLGCMTASSKVETCLVNCSKSSIFLVLYIQLGLILDCIHLPRHSVSHVFLACSCDPTKSLPLHHATNMDHCSETRNMAVKHSKAIHKFNLPGETPIRSA